MYWRAEQRVASRSRKEDFDFDMISKAEIGTMFQDKNKCFLCKENQFESNCDAFFNFVYLIRLNWLVWVWNSNNNLTCFDPGKKSMITDL